MTRIDSFTHSMWIFSETLRYIHISHDVNEDVVQLKESWADQVMRKLKLKLEVKGQVSNRNSVLFLGNHISYLDIVVLMKAAPKSSFVAKNFINHWPIIGSAARRLDTVFVKRNKKSSRVAARESIKDALEAGTQIAMFPAGTTTMHEQKAWRKGAFEIAHETDRFIQPFRIRYKPLRKAAYIDNDFFPVHLYKLFRYGGIEASIEFHDPVKVENPIEDCEKWRNWARK